MATKVAELTKELQAATKKAVSGQLARSFEDVLRRAYVSGQEASFHADADDIAAAGRELSQSWRAVKSNLEKVAPPKWGGPLGIPVGSLKNLADSLQEMAYWAGAFQGPRR